MYPNGVVTQSQVAQVNICHLCYLKIAQFSPVFLTVENNPLIKKCLTTGVPRNRPPQDPRGVLCRGPYGGPEVGGGGLMSEVPL